MGCTINNPSTPKVEAEGLEVQGDPWLYQEFKARLGYMRLCLKKKKKGRKMRRKEGKESVVSCQQQL